MGGGCLNDMYFCGCLYVDVAVSQHANLDFSKLGFEDGFMR